jgi:hypothetical protein
MVPGKAKKRSVELTCAGCSPREFTNTGRTQSFVHYAGSQLPVRDFRRRTEPHIEVGAAGYVRREMQTAIRSFCRSCERYLFLTTTCRNQAIAGGRFLGKRFVVGYIARLMCIRPRGRWTVFGAVAIVPFDARLEFRKLGIRTGRWAVRFGEAKTRRLLKLINSLPNIREKCVREMVELEKLETRKGVTVAAARECLDKKGKCVLKERCLRKKLARRRC